MAKELSDQDALRSIAVHPGVDLEVREAAVEKLSDQELLCSLAVSHGTSLEVRQAAVKALVDQSVLVRVAMTEPKWCGSKELEEEDVNVYRAALKKISDQAALENIVKTGERRRVCYWALEEVTNQAFLADLAWSEDSRLGVPALQRLTSQSVLGEIAKDGRYSVIREEAVKNLHDEGILAEIALTDKHLGVRRAALKKLTGQKEIFRIARSAPEEDIRYEAVGMLTDRELLAVVAESDSSTNVRVAALRRLDDETVQSYAVEIADRSGDARASELQWLLERMKTSDIEKMTNQEALCAAAAAVRRKDLREAVVKRLNNEQSAVLVRRIEEQFDADVWEPRYPFNAAAFNNEARVLDSLALLVLLRSHGSASAGELLKRVRKAASAAAGPDRFVLIGQYHHGNRRVAFAEAILKEFWPSER
jgi:uncharacterized DUF497 family protein